MTYKAPTLAGDVTGAPDSNTVIHINGTSVPASPSANQALVASSSSASTWALLVDANISSSAAISGTKVNPAFGTQNISTSYSSMLIWVLEEI